MCSAPWGTRPTTTAPRSSSRAMTSRGRATRSSGRAPHRRRRAARQAAAGTAVHGAVMVRAPHPRPQPYVLRAVGAAAAPDGPPLIVPRYDAPGPRHPVLLSRAAWPLPDSLSGDRGLGSLIDARPDLVREVRVTGTMPDIDRPDDLAALLEGAP